LAAVPVVTLALIGGLHDDSSCAASPAAGSGSVRITALPGVDLRPVLSLPGLSAASGPFPGAQASMRMKGRETGVWLEGRNVSQSPVDPVPLRRGSWVNRGEVVVSASVARSLRVDVGSRVRMPGAKARLRVSGIAAESTRRSIGRDLPSAFVARRDLGRLGVGRARTGSSVLLQPSRETGTAPIADWLEARYPAAQAEVTSAAVACS
jgi:hypothetical protein